MMTAASQHSSSFKFRRFPNRIPLGLTYACLYMGRYNLTVSKNALGELMTKEDFGIIFGVGTLTYAFSFLVNGPLVDRIGGRKGALIAAIGSGTMNLVMGLYLSWVLASGTATNDQIRLVFSVLYALNMYFQSYGAVAIVKVNAHWFHVRERGSFSGIFGTMISSGIFLAFTVNNWILHAAAGDGPELHAAKWVFFAPAVLLYVFFLIEAFLLKDRPSLAGHEDFDTGDASSGEDDKPVPTMQIIKRILTHPVILTVALIEFCTGVVRNGVMHWFPIYAKEIWVLPGSHYLRYGSWGNWMIPVGMFIIAALFFFMGSKARGNRKGWLLVSGALVFLAPFLQGGWGGILFVAGVIGGNVAGWVSDLFFGSRRMPVAGILYGLLILASIGMIFGLGGTENRVGWASGSHEPASGTLITAVGESPVSDWNEVDAALRALAAGAPAGATEMDIDLAVETEAGSRSVRLTVAVVDGETANWGLLPSGSGRMTDPAAEPRLLALQPGDRILGLAATPTLLAQGLAEGPFENWKQVSGAVRAVPALPDGAGGWCPDKSMVTYDGTGIPAGESPSTGLLYARLDRDGEVLDVALRDPAPTLRAGDYRKLRAGPVLTLNPIWLGVMIFIMSICVIGTHGLLSGTATMDFGGRKGAATAVGMIDGFVYLGTGLQSFALGRLTTMNWAYWPLFLLRFGIIGLVLLTRIWHAKPGGSGGH